MRAYNWTEKREAALKFLIMTHGNADAAAQISQQEGPKISVHYFNSLKSRPEHRPFRDAYYAETEKKLSALDIDADYVLQRLQREAEQAKEGSARVNALKLLGQYLRLFTEKRELEVKGEVDVNLGGITDAELDAIIGFTQGGLRRKGEEGEQSPNT